MEKGKTLNYMAPKIKTWSLNAGAICATSLIDGGDSSTQQYGFGDIYNID